MTRHPLNANWPLETLSTLPLTEHGGRTTRALRWAPHAATEAERQTLDSNHDSTRQGWTGTLDQLDEYLAKTKP